MDKGFFYRFLVTDNVPAPATDSRDSIQPTTQRPQRENMIPREEGPERAAKLAKLAVMGKRLNPAKWVQELAANDVGTGEKTPLPREEPQRRAARR